MINSQKKGFTLIETLVAISILMIAIAGPLTVATKAYTASLDARNQTIAINLAQETMEYLNNIKDVHEGFGSIASSGQCNSVSSACDISITGEGKFKSDYFIECGSNKVNCVLNISDIIGYNHETPEIDNIPSSFTRYYYIMDLSPTDKQKLATVVVSWNTGSASNDITLQSVLTSIPR